MPRVQGVGAMRRTLDRLAAEIPDAVALALAQETEIEATEAKRLTPVDTGNLRGSIHVEGPHRRGRRIVTAIVAGGPAAPYAVAVHEDLEAQHPTGQAKFIEAVIFESAPHLATRIVRRIDLNPLTG